MARSNEEKIGLYKSIKGAYQSKDSSFDWWLTNSGRSELGIYNVDTKLRKLSLRASDKTASTAVYPELQIKDFGGGDGIDDPVSRIMSNTNLTFLEAVDLFLSWEGAEDYEYNPPKASAPKKDKEIAAPYKDSYIRNTMLAKARNSARYEELAKDLFRSCSKEEKLNGERLFSIGFIPKENADFEGASDRIFVPEYDQNKIPYGSYRYNRNDKDRKGLLRRDSKRVLFGSHLISTMTNVVFAEGHTDTIVNCSKGIQCVTTGSATKRFEENIAILAGRNILDFPDLDLAGIFGAVNRSIEIAAWNADCVEEDRISHQIHIWAEGFIDNKIIERVNNGDSLTKEIYYPFLNEIFEYGFSKKLMLNLAIMYAEKKGFQLDVSNWKFISKGFKKAGYDWIDFHTENQEKEGYSAFISKLK